MSEHLAAAAAALNAPEAMVKRSAEARAKATGTPVDDILAAWAGGGSAPAPVAPATAAPAPAPAAPAQSTTTEASPASEQSTPVVETPADAPPAAVPAASPPGAVTPLPAPASVTPEQALSHPVVISVPTAGLKERTSGVLPRWLAAAFMVVPMFGLIYLSANLSSPGCVEGGFELAVDRATGVVENCDGSAFEGRGGASGEGTAFLASGRELYTSAGCAGCHGAGGGGGTGPAFTNVLLTFGSCADHVEWVLLGSSGFQAAGRSTYGDIAKPIAGGMPGYPALSAEDLAAVVAFERAIFGGGNPEEVLVDCDLVEGAEDPDAEVEDGGDATEGSGPTEGASTDTTMGGEARVGSNG
jgi:mono/diheme cytochrome c family protein